MKTLTKKIFFDVSVIFMALTATGDTSYAAGHLESGSLLIVGELPHETLRSYYHFGTIIVVLLAIIGYLIYRLSQKRTSGLDKLQDELKLLCDTRNPAARLPEHKDDLQGIVTSVNQLMSNMEQQNKSLFEKYEEQKAEIEKYAARISELEQSNENLYSILESMPDATLVIDKDRKVIVWNRAMEELTGVNKSTMLGQDNYAYSMALHKEAGPVLIDLVGPNTSLQTLPNEKVTQRGHILSTNTFDKSISHGKSTYLWAKAAPVLNDREEVLGAIETIQDVTTYSKTEQELKYLQMHDQLTGFFNSAYLTQEMNRVTAEGCAPISCIVCNIDGLKLINDTLGFRAGDSVLLSAAEIIREAITEQDVVARIGGDEFSILLPGSGKEQLEIICTKIREGMERHNVEYPHLPLSISLGSAFSNKPVSDLRDLFKEADNNMFHEKLYYNPDIQTATVKILMKALEAKDFIKEGHVDRLQSILVSVGAAIGMTPRRLNGMRLLAKFHDIGKVGIPDRILLKQGPLSPAEVTEMQRHCEIGFRIAQNAPVLVPIADWILKHHEWWNGKGYPLGLQDKEIPLECRLFAIADAYDALTSDRPYRKAMPHEKAAAELNKRVGTQFDPELVKTFLEILDAEQGKTKVQVINPET